MMIARARRWAGHIPVPLWLLTAICAAQMASALAVPVIHALLASPEIRDAYLGRGAGARG